MLSNKKLLQGSMELILPLAALLLGILIMLLETPAVIQSGLPVPLSQTFSGEYSYDQENWYPLESSGDLSALDGDLYLRGHFNETIYPECRLYYFSDHIGSAIYVNGEVYARDMFLELEICGIELQPATCCRGWKFFYFDQELPAGSPVEVYLKNPHTFGNKNAYRDFLNTMYCTANNPDYFAKSLAGTAKPFLIAGIILVIIALLLLGYALIGVCVRIPVGFSVIQYGLLTGFVGGFFLLDTIDLTFWSESIVFNTFGWQICMMYTVYLLGILVKDTLEGKRKKIASWVMAFSSLTNMVLILLSFSGVVLMYDTLFYWVLSQWICCPVLALCCGAELRAGDRSKRWPLCIFLMIFACILLDAMGALDSIYSTGPLTKSAVIVLLLFEFFQSARRILLNYRASSRAHILEKELEESRIAIMLSQIQPHFIFNVLGTIRGLCREDPVQAWRGLGDFSTYLRGNMNALTNKKSIPFAMELQHVETYLRLEQMRLGQKMHVVYDIQEKEFSIPPLMLQPLVENAVKHGIFYKADGGTIVIHSKKENGRIILSVQDDGIGFEASAQEQAYDQREHLGLENVRNRVENMLNGCLRIESSRDHGSTVTLEFPVDDHS